MIDEADVTLSLEGSLNDDLAAFRSAWERTERGEKVETERVIAFESWEALASVLTGERYRLLKHLRTQPEASVSALARNVHRHLRRVQADVKALESIGLVKRAPGVVRATSAKVTAVL